MSTATIDPRDPAFERLYRRYARDVYRFVLHVVRNPQEAEDVTQTAFLNAYRAYQRGVRPERPRNWLLVIARNAIRSRNRWTLRRPTEVALDDALLDLAVPAAERSDVVEVMQALSELPVNQREALAMRALEGRSYPEIAETLGVTVPAVESLIHRARKTLRAQRTSLRGLAVVQLPRSLRRWLEQGDPAGAGLTAKAVAALAVATVVAGGIGVGSKGAGASHREPGAPVRLEPRRHAVIAPAVAPSPVIHGVKSSPAARLRAPSSPPVPAATHAVAAPPAAPDAPTPAAAAPTAPASAVPAPAAPQPAATPAVTLDPPPLPAPPDMSALPPLPAVSPLPDPPPVTVPSITVPAVP